MVDVVDDVDVVEVELELDVEVALVLVEVDDVDEVVVPEPPIVVVDVVDAATSDVVVVAGTGPMMPATHWSTAARTGAASPTVRHDAPGSSFANFASRMRSRFCRQAALGAATRSTAER